jgi:hypothetical protein
MTQHIAHIGRCLAIAWDTARSLDGARACIVSGEGQMHYPELVEHLTQILRRAEEVRCGIEAIWHTKVARGPRHQLTQASGTSLADRQGVIPGPSCASRD